MGNSERDLQFWRQCTPQAVAYMTGYENTYGVYGFANGCYFQGNGIGHGSGNGIASHNQIEDYKNIRSVISSLNALNVKQRLTVEKLDELYLHLKKESDEKSKNETEFAKQNKELRAENSKLTAQLAEIKLNVKEIAKVKSIYNCSS